MREASARTAMSRAVLLDMSAARSAACAVARSSVASDATAAACVSSARPAHNQVSSQRHNGEGDLRTLDVALLCELAEQRSLALLQRQIRSAIKYCRACSAASSCARPASHVDRSCPLPLPPVRCVARGNPRAAAGRRHAATSRGCGRVSRCAPSSARKQREHAGCAQPCTTYQASCCATRSGALTATPRYRAIYAAGSAPSESGTRRSTVRRRAPYSCHRTQRRRSRDTHSSWAARAHRCHVALAMPPDRWPASRPHSPDSEFRRWRRRGARARPQRSETRIVLKRTAGTSDGRTSARLLGRWAL